MKVPLKVRVRVAMWRAVDAVFAKVLCVRHLGKSRKYKGDK